MKNKHLPGQRSMDFLSLCLLTIIFIIPLQGADNQSAATGPDAQEKLLMEGRELINSGQPEAAIRDSFDKVIRHFEAQYAGSEKLIFCARNTAETLFYLAMSASTEKGAEVLGSTWADAYLMKGYALVEPPESWSTLKVSVGKG